MRRKQIILLMMGWLISGMAISREKLTLDLEAAKKQALEYNRTLKNSELAIDQSQEMLWETIAAGLPQVNATADYSNAMGAEISIQFNESQDPTRIPIKPSSNFNLQLGQLIFNGSYLVGIQTAKLATKLSQKNLEKMHYDYIRSIKVKLRWYPNVV